MELRTVTPNIPAFEAEFQAACRRHGISAAFVAVKSSGEKGSLLVIGGSAELSDFIEKALTPHTAEFQAPKN